MGAVHNRAHAGRHRGVVDADRGHARERPGALQLAVDQEIVVPIGLRPPVGEELAFLLRLQRAHTRVPHLSTGHLTVLDGRAHAPGHTVDERVLVVDRDPDVARTGEERMKGEDHLVQPVIDQPGFSLALR